MKPSKILHILMLVALIGDMIAAPLRSSQDAMLENPRFYGRDPLSPLLRRMGRRNHQDDSSFNETLSRLRHPEIYHMLDSYLFERLLEKLGKREKKNYIADKRVSHSLAMPWLRNKKNRIDDFPHLRFVARTNRQFDRTN